MEFTSLAFAAFLFVCVPIYHLTPLHHKVRVLFAASLFFYSVWSLKFAAVLLAATTFAFVSGAWIESASEERTRNRRLVAGIAALTLFLCAFKYLPAALDSIGPWRGGGVRWIAPLGISYYVFKLISYLIDVGWGKIQAETNWLEFATYTIFFPQIVAGPIQRSECLIPKIRKARQPDSEMLSAALRRILLGVFKKLVVADNLAVAIDLVYGHPLEYAGAPILIAIYLYPIQLYMDFSGLIDIAIGVAGLFGIESPENFNVPFAASSIGEFWRRWHMTLTNWLTEYVFNPLRMATRNLGRWGLILSITANMVLIGIWHGPHLGFAVFGLVHAVFLCVDALSGRSRAKFFKRHPFWNALAIPLGIVLTWHLVIFADIFFRAETLSPALLIIKKIPAAFLQLSQLSAAITILDRKPLLHGLFGLGLVLGYFLLSRNRRMRFSIMRLPWPARWVVYYAATVLIVQWGVMDKQFIYFKF